ncbi:AAA family ATPase [Pedobacter sp. UBA4863]|uniref:AAA family ATPase n=1 Tax=Pedobacter sp. UBA4863 TaxID=1947060 RepID=UPI0025F12D19|nr:AAA family ATPase [Pedobacter sp. UBA4863]
MGQTLTQIAQKLKDANKKVQLIYAFNGTGKTRLSREFKQLIAPKGVDVEEAEALKIMYYNAFTEDLFYWDNDLNGDTERKLIIRPNSFTEWVLVEEGQENNITSIFQHYTNDKLTPIFNEEYVYYDEVGNVIIVSAYSEVTFSIKTGDDQSVDNVKISKGEESCFIWSVFYCLLNQVISVLNISEDRETKKFDDLEYVFIDDPVSSLDDNHLIELAVNLAQLIKSSESEKLKFIITTHNPLFYNVLFNEFNREKRIAKYRLEKLEDGTYLMENSNDAPFSYHLFLLSELDSVIKSREIKKYHFNILRNILEKSATFLGYDHWEELLSNETEGAREGYYKRIINFSSHSKFSGEEIPVVLESEKAMLERIVGDFKKRHGFK